ncbi:MAG: class F sortase [Marmoricola sp.]
MGASWWWTGDRPPDTAAASAAAVAPAAAAAAEVAAPAAPRAPWRPGAPRRVVIPALGVDAPVVPIRLSGRALVPPGDARELGWWAGGALPGSKHGAALVSGHTVHTGGGALDHLGRLHPGDRVVVGTDRGRLVYRVARVETPSKQQLARRARALFGSSGPGRLVLVTCGDWDGTSYLSNVVVIARPASAR